VAGHKQQTQLLRDYSIFALLSSVDGNPGLTSAGQGNTARTYDVFANLIRFQVKSLGVQRVGVYG